MGQGNDAPLCDTVMRFSLCENAKNEYPESALSIRIDLTFDPNRFDLRAMPNLQVVEKEEIVAVGWMSHPATRRLIIQWTVAVAAAFVLGTWLVWWAAYSQRHFALEEIRASCQRVMPETVDRCVDTVIIQRGGARR